MQNMIQNLLAQQGLQAGTTTPTTEEELLKHQRPVAAAMQAMMKILEYEKTYLSPEFFAQMVDSLQENIIKAFNQIKMPPISMNDIVSIHGEPATVSSSNGQSVHTTPTTQTQET